MSRWGRFFLLRWVGVTTRGFRRFPLVPGGREAFVSWPNRSRAFVARATSVLGLFLVGVTDVECFRVIADSSTMMPGKGAPPAGAQPLSGSPSGSEDEQPRGHKRSRTGSFTGVGGVTLGPSVVGQVSPIFRLASGSPAPRLVFRGRPRPLVIPEASRATAWCPGNGPSPRHALRGRRPPLPRSKCAYR